MEPNNQAMSAGPNKKAKSAGPTLKLGLRTDKTTIGSPLPKNMM